MPWPDDGQPRNSKNHEFVDKVAEANVELVIKEIRERSPILRKCWIRAKLAWSAACMIFPQGRSGFLTSR